MPKVNRNFYKKLAPLLFAACAFLLLCLFSGAAVDSARAGLITCARVIIPSLFPFFVLAGLLTRLGLPEYLGRLAEPLMGLLFGVPGAGASAFVIGLSGGYPLGAANVAELYRRKLVTRDEAERLLAFCDNTGPAFMLGAAGAGVFRSLGCGILLYLSHVLAAVTVGVLMRGKSGKNQARRPRRPVLAVSFSQAFAESVKASALSIVSICGFVVFFTAAAGILDSAGVFSSLAGRLAAGLGLELHWTRSLLHGFLELGGGIASMSGLSPRPLSLALAAFIIGWGGLSVHCQVLAVLEGTDIKTARHTAGRLMSGVFSAVYAFLGATFLF